MSSEHWQSRALAHEFNTFRAMHGGSLPIADLHRALFPDKITPARLGEVTRMVEYLRHVASGDLAAMRVLEGEQPRRVVTVYPDTPVRLAHHLLHQDVGFDAGAQAGLRATYEPVLSHLHSGGI